MKRTWRIMALLLVVFMTLALLNGCKDGKDPKETTAREARTFGGRTFTIASNWADGIWRAFPEQSAEQAEKQAIYDQMERDLDIKIEILDGVHAAEDIIPSLIAGDIPSDVVDFKIHGWMPLAVQGLIVPYDDPRLVAGGLDVEDPAVFFQPFTKAQKWNGKIYGAMWNGKHFVAEFGWCIYFNKKLVADAGVSDLYQVVRDGKWDWNFFRDLAIKTTKDYDGDGKIDVYGVGTFGYGSELFTNPGAEIIRNENGKMKVVLSEPAALDALEFTRQFAFLDKVRHPDGYGDVHRQFTDGKVAMVWGEQWNTHGDDMQFKTTDVDYGLVPMPKAPGADYYVNVLGGVHSVSIYAGHPDEDLKDVAYILSEMGRRFTSDDWQESYLESDLRGDEEALEMVLDYIWPHTVTDYVWSSVPILEFFRNNIYLPMTEGEGTAIQLVEKYEAELQAEVDALFRQ
jgi:ABC-type glycerol-3-phosphate transport system substrate-binding protein